MEGNETAPGMTPEAVTSDAVVPRSGAMVGMIDAASDDAFAMATAAFAEATRAEAETAGAAGDEAASVEADGAETGATTPPSEGSHETADDELTRLRAENEQLRANQPPPPPHEGAQQLRRFVGLDPIHEGGPDLAAIERAITSRDYRALNEMRRPDGQYGYSLEEAIDLRAELVGRGQLMSQNAGLFHQMAWSAIGKAFDDAAAASGLDAKALADEAAASGNPLAVSAHYLDRITAAARKAGEAEGGKEWKGRHDALKAEFDAFRARTAGSAAGLESGGRGNAPRPLASVLAEADRDPEAFVERAIRGDFAHLDMRGS